MVDKKSFKYNKDTALTSVPMFAKYAGINSVQDVAYERLVVKMKDPNNEDHTNAFLRDIRQAEYSALDFDIQNHNDLKSTFEQVTVILDMIFNIIIAITMMICFFSLSSSMSANLYESSKEIGILRAMGLSKHRIRALYIYEAFVLVMASCLLGILIGTTVGFTMTLQQMLFTDIPLVFYFPFTQFLIILFLSILCAFASTYSPAKNLTNKQISAIFRIT